LPSLVDRELSLKLGSLPRPRCVKLGAGPSASDAPLAGDTDEVHYRRPGGHYVRYIGRFWIALSSCEFLLIKGLTIDPAEKDLFEMTEYDMDEQDRYWLGVLNTERKAEGETEVSEAFFEAVMDKMDKEWFGLVSFMKHIDGLKNDSDDRGFPDERDS
jgi:hypothetical protein